MTKEIQNGKKGGENGSLTLRHIFKDSSRFIETSRQALKKQKEADEFANL